MTQNQYRTWLELVGLDKTASGAICPECGHHDIHFQYVGDVRSRIGFLDIWCHSCVNGIHISRTKAPESVTMISFEEMDEYRSRVPKFTPIDP